MIAPRGVVGVLHLPALPGDPGQRSASFADVERFVLTDADALIAGGVDALILENFGSTPFVKGTEGHRLPPHQVATLAILARSVRERCALPVGVNCLRNDAHSAIGIAAAADLAFVRVNVHTGAYVTDQGLLEGEAATTLRYRASLGAHSVAILADVLVKHASPLAPVSMTQAVQDTLHRGRADGVVVSGRATGAPVDRVLLDEARAAAGRAPLLLGSGLTPQRVDELAPLADGAIVGTYFKRGGVVTEPVDPARVRDLVSAARGRFRSH